MRKDLTTKDVLYALEYLGDQMVRTPVRDGVAQWTMQAGGQTVKPAVANEVCASGAVTSFEDRGRTFVMWRRAA